MRFPCFLVTTASLLLFKSSAVSSSSSTPLETQQQQPPLLSLTTDPTGASYTISVGGTIWFNSPDILFAVDGVAYSAVQKTLEPSSSSFSSRGTNGIGTYLSTTFSWVATDAASTPLNTTFYFYDSGNAIGFATSYPAGTKSQSLNTLNSTGTLVSTFPSFFTTSTTPSPLGVLFQVPDSGNCGWTIAPSSTFPQASGGLQVISPAVNSLSLPSSRISLGFAALEEHPVVRQAVIPIPASSSASSSSSTTMGLTASPGAEFNLPAGYSAQVILVATSAAYSTSSSHANSFSPSLSSSSSISSPQLNFTRADAGIPSGGPTSAVFTLGDALLAYHNKPRPSINFDRIHERLGYGTTAFYFYNPCNCGRWPNNTCPPSNNPVPDCTTYYDTMIQVNAALLEQQIPYGHMLLDSFWYGEGVYGGVSEWEDDPALMAAVNSFPPGMHALNEALGGTAAVDMWAHNGRWVTSSPYLSQYPFYPNTTMPQGRQLWDHLFQSNSKGWNLRTIKQDHVGEQIGLAGTITNASQIKEWLNGMGEAALDANVNIQYCCSPPLVLINSVSVPTANGARSSPDYVEYAPGRGDINYPRYQWANGGESAFHYALGLMPDKDGFYSNSTQIQLGTGLPEAEKPSFFNWTETNALKHALMAVMCGGPVHVSDEIGSTNKTLVWSFLRGDGVILRPSRPHAAIDAEWKSMMFHGWLVVDDEEEVTNVALYNAHVKKQEQEQQQQQQLLNSDTQFPNSGIGEIYSSVTILPLLGGPSSSCLRWSIITAMEITVPVNLTDVDLALDSASILTSTCVANTDGTAWVTYDWDLTVFTLSTETAFPRPVFGSNNNNNAGGNMIEILLTPTIDHNLYIAPPRMILVAPVINEWVLLGEMGKMVPLSSQRISGLYVGPSGGPNALQVSLQGAAGEVVTFLACTVSSVSEGCAGNVPAAFTCTLPASGSATLNIPGGACA